MAGAHVLIFRFSKQEALHFQQRELGYPHTRVRWMNCGREKASRCVSDVISSVPDRTSI